MADEFARSIEGGKKHAVTAIVSGQNGFMVYGPGTMNGAAFGGSQRFHITIFIEAGPDEGELASLFKKERTIGDKITLALYMVYPGSITGLQL